MCENAERNESRPAHKSGSRVPSSPSTALNLSAVCQPRVSCLVLTRAGAYSALLHAPAMEPPPEAADVDFSEVFAGDKIAFNNSKLNYWRTPCR